MHDDLTLRSESFHDRLHTEGHEKSNRTTFQSDQILVTGHDWRRESVESDVFSDGQCNHLPINTTDYDRNRASGILSLPCDHEEFIAKDLLFDTVLGPSIENGHDQNDRNPSLTSDQSVTDDVFLANDHDLQQNRKHYDPIQSDDYQVSHLERPHHQQLHKSVSDHKCSYNATSCHDTASNRLYLQTMGAPVVRSRSSPCNGDQLGCDAPVVLHSPLVEAPDAPPEEVPVPLSNVHLSTQNIRKTIFYKDTVLVLWIRILYVSDPVPYLLKEKLVLRIHIG